MTCCNTKKEPILSPSGKYRLEVESHATKPGCWNYTTGLVYRVETGSLIAKIQRNYSSFPYSWVEGHSITGRDYLICGSDYQGQTFVDLTTGEVKDHLESAAEKGHGFCWAAHWPSPDGTMIAVSGCIWACPYEIRIYDFSDPMADHLPIEIYRDDERDDFAEWIDDHSCRIGHTTDAFNMPGHPLHGKTEYEMESLEDYSDALDEVTRIAAERGVCEDSLFSEMLLNPLVWTKPDSWLDVARKYVERIGWSEGYDEASKRDDEGWGLLAVIQESLTEQESSSLNTEMPKILEDWKAEATKRRISWEKAWAKHKEKEATT